MLVGNTSGFHFPGTAVFKGSNKPCPSGGTEVKFLSGSRAGGDLDGDAALCWCLGDVYSPIGQSG